MRLVKIGDVRLIVELHGPVSWSRLEDVISCLRSAYSSAGGGTVELHLYSSVDLMQATLEERASEEGVAVAASFPAVFEAWTGLPALHIPVEVVGLSSEEWCSMLVHEAIHSILHDSINYYLYEPIADPLEYYIAATSVKDLEVHAYMHKRGLARHLVVLRGYWLREIPHRVETVEDLFNVLKAATAWTCCGMEPPLNYSSIPALRRLLHWQTDAAGAWLRGGDRPWARRHEYVLLLSRLFESILPGPGSLRER